MNYVLALAVSIIVTAVFVRPLSALANKIGFVDMPTERKNHKTPAPHVGGVAMFLGFLAAYLIFLPSHISADTFRYISVLIGALLILGIGLVDDFSKAKKKEFPALPRLIVHIGAAVLIFAADIRFWGFTVPWTGELVVFHISVQFIITIMWILGVTTVINWVDGLDGLAGGVSGITAVTLFIFAAFMGETSSAVMSVALVGSVMAFLRFNFFRTKTKVFMGDSGANFLGYMLAVISLHGAFKQATLISIIIPVLALGLPVFDGLFVMVKRFLTRKPIYKADHTHIHQRLQKKGLNPKQTVIFLLLFCTCLNLTSIIIMLL